MSPATLSQTISLTGRGVHDDRVRLHGKVAPTTMPIDKVRAGMETLAHTQPIVGWKTYARLLRSGWRLDDHEAGAPQVGEPFVRGSR